MRPMQCDCPHRPVSIPALQSKKLMKRMSQFVVALVLALLACQPVLADASCVSGALGQGAQRVCNMAMAMAPTSSMGADCAMGSTSAARFCAPNCCQSSLYQSVGLL